MRIEAYRCDMCGGDHVGEPTMVYGPTPTAALVALAAAHIEARKEGKE